MKNFPAKLKRARKARGHSQEQAAREMGVTTSAVSKWEAGYRAPTGLYAQVVEEYLEAEKGE